MKLLKKLLPIATIASTVAVVAPIMTSCGGVGTGTTSVKDYKTKFTPLAEGTTVSSDTEGVKAYFTDENAKNIISDDVMTQAAALVNSEDFQEIAAYFTSWSINAGVSISNIDTTKETISGAISLNASVEGTIPAELAGMKISGKASASANFTVTNLNYGGGYDIYDEAWYFGLGTTKALLKETSGKVVGNISWKASDVKINDVAISEVEALKDYVKYLTHDTGTRTITADNYTESWTGTELDEKFDLYLISSAMSLCEWTSNYFKNVTIAVTK